MCPLVRETVFLKRLLHHLVKQRLEASVPAASQGHRSSGDLPTLQLPLQKQNVTFSNAGLFELLGSLEPQ